MKAFVEIDLVQAEWVVTAYCSRDARMLQVVKDRLDPHLRTGSIISGAPESFVAFEDGIVGHMTDPVDIDEARKALPKTWTDRGKTYNVADFFLPRSMSIRQAGKKSNHALNYDMGYRRFALENEVDESEAKVIVETYKTIAYPGLQTYYRDIQWELRNNDRRVKNCFGQTRKFMGRWDADLLLAAYSFKPQSTVGNVANFGLRRIYRDDEGCMARVQLCAQVHDSILCQHTFDTWEELADQVHRCDTHLTTTCTYHEEDFQLRREVAIGRDWGEESMIEVRDYTPDTLADALKAAWEGGCGPTAA
jgi:DNA polymerase I-like protein with 3'-5' exonuclease and polymerase domains